MKEYAEYLESEATKDGGRYQEAVNKFEEITAERDDWLSEIDILSIKQTPNMSFDTIDTLKELKQQMIDAVNDEYSPKIHDCAIRIAYYGKEKINRITTVNVTYRIVNTEKPEEYIDVSSSGTGVDTQDKGVGKAMTYAYKYMLLRTFAIPTGDDADKLSSDLYDAGLYGEPTEKEGREADAAKADEINENFNLASVEPMATKEQIESIIKGCDITGTIVASIAKHYGVEALKNLTQEQAKEVLKRLSNKANRQADAV